MNRTVSEEVKSKNRKKVKKDKNTAHITTLLHFFTPQNFVKLRKLPKLVKMTTMKIEHKAFEALLKTKGISKKPSPLTAAFPTIPSPAEKSREKYPTTR